MPGRHTAKQKRQSESVLKDVKSPSLAPAPAPKVKPLAYDEPKVSLATRLAGVRGDYARRTGDTAGAMPKPAKPVPAMDYSKMKKPSGPAVAQKSMEKGPGFKPTPIASRTSGAKTRTSGETPAKKPINLEIGPATVTSMPKKPIDLEIGPATVTSMPKKPIGLEIGEAVVTPHKPTPPSGQSKPLVARKGDDLSGGEAYAAMGKGRSLTPAEAAFREETEKLKRRAGSTRKRPFGRRGITAFGKAAEVALPRPKTKWATPRENMSRMDYGARRKGNFFERRRQGIKDLGTVTVSAKEKSMGKSLQVVSIGDYYDSVMKAEPGAPKKFSRKLKPMTKMKPLSDQQAVTNLRAGKSAEKSLVMLAAIKALVSGYGKVSGGGALRAPNRGFMSVGDLQRAMEAMPKPSGPVPPATTYLPGVHGPEVKQRAAKIRAKTSKRVAAKADYASSMEEPTLKKKQNVVHKAEGDASMSKTNFNDLFKSELGVANDDVLVDCPHCEAPITKSDLAKAHKGKGATTNVSGPKTAGGNLRSQNPEGGTMRGGDGKGQVTPSRGVPGAQKTDVVAGVQNSKGSKTHKAMDDESSCADDVSSAGAASSKAKKSMGSVRGTEFVQYINYGDAPGSDASIAKSIAEAQGALGQQATQPMDLNNDLSRLLV